MCRDTAYRQRVAVAAIPPRGTPRCRMTKGMPRIPFHPELRRLGLALPKSVINPFTLRFTRKLTRLPHRRPPKDVEVVTVAPGVRVWVYRAGTGCGPGLLWIHGGGYLIGSPGQDD